MTVHELLRARRDEVIQRCAGRYRERHPERPEDELLDTIPTFLDELFGHGPDDAASDRENARRHGAQRFAHGYPIQELAMDYGTISQVIGEIAREHGQDLDPRFYLALNRSLDMAIYESIARYFELVCERDQREAARSMGALGHELRNALASATVAYAALQSGQVGIDSQTSRVLERSLRRLDLLITQSLSSARLEARSPLALERLGVRALIDDIVAGTLVSRGVRVRVDIVDGLELEADPHLLESAVANLVSNAVKFTRDRGVVTLSARAASGGVVFEIADECGGLADDDPQRLFLPFVQGQKRVGGVGLGMSIARDAIAAHGGTVEVDDVPGHGCVFRAWLPTT